MLVGEVIGVLSEGYKAGPGGTYVGDQRVSLSPGVAQAPIDGLGSGIKK